jgi:threonine/homoserine/homoserine lactone efflux protein
MTLALPTRLTFPIIFGIALATGFSGAVVPGSLLAVVVTESVRFGWVAGPLLMVGHGLLELVAVILLVTGLIAFARAARPRGAIGVLGGLVLLYLGYLTVQIPGETAAQALQTASPATTHVARSWLHLALLGGLMSMANPYWWLWWATIGVAHIGWATQRGLAGGGTYLVGHVLADVVWYCAVAVTLAAGRTLFSAGVLRGIYVACGAFLLVLGAAFIIAGARALRLQQREGPAQEAGR